MGLVLSTSSRTYVRDRPAVNSASSLASAGAAFGAPRPVSEAKQKAKPKSKAASKAKAKARTPDAPGLLGRLATPEVLGTGAALGLAAVFVALVAGSLKNPSPA